MGFWQQGSVVGIDLGSDSVKAVQLRKNGKLWTTARIGVAPLPTPATAAGEALPGDAIINCIKAALANAAIKTKEVVATVSGRDLLLRRVRFPNMPVEELREAIRWEMEKFFPLTYEEAVIDWDILSQTGGERGQQEVLLIAVKRQIVDNYLELFAEAGLDLLALDAEPCAVLRALQLDEGIDPQQTVMVVDIGLGSTKVVIGKGDVPYLLRTIPLGGRDFTAAVVRGQGLDFAAAEVYKQQHGIISGDDTYTGILQEFSTHLRHCVDYFMLQGEGDMIETVVLCGGGANLAGLVGVCAQELGMPVLLANPLQKLNIAGHNVIETEQLAPLCLTGIGLALRKGEQ